MAADGHLGMRALSHVTLASAGLSWLCCCLSWRYKDVLFQIRRRAKTWPFEPAELYIVCTIYTGSLDAASVVSQYLAADRHQCVCAHTTARCIPINFLPCVGPGRRPHKLYTLDGASVIDFAQTRHSRWQRKSTVSGSVDDKSEKVSQLQSSRN